MFFLKEKMMVRNPKLSIRETLTIYRERQPFIRMTMGSNRVLSLKDMTEI
jgi:hypothetical protein